MTVPEKVAGINEPRARAGDAENDPRPSTVSFVTSEHFALQSARAATIAESVGRATMFLTSASGGMIALGLVSIAASRHSLAAALISRVVVGLAAITVLMRFQVGAYRRAGTGRLLADLDSRDAQ